MCVQLSTKKDIKNWAVKSLELYYRLIVTVVMEAVEVKLLVVVIDRLAGFTLVLQHFISMIFLLFSFFFLKGTN